MTPSRRDVPASQRGAPAARSARVVRTLGAAPFALSMAFLLLLTTTWTRTSAGDDDALFDWVSTNVHNLSVAPIRSLVLSALFLPDGRWLLDSARLLAVLVPLERRIGTVRSLAAFASAHVLATLLTEGWVWWGLRTGAVPRAAAYQQDVGISYGLYGVAGAVLYFVPGRFRPWLVAALAGYLIVPFAQTPDLTATGHLLSLAIGLAWWPVLGRFSASRPAADAPGAGCPAGSPS